MAPWEEPVTLGMGRWGRSIATYARVRGAILGGALLSVLAVTGPATPLVAAEPEPVFHMPFPCGETWSASTRVASSAHADATNAYPAHDPSVWATDWNHASPEGLPDDRGMAVLAGADGGTVTEVHLEEDPASIGYGNYVTVAYPGGVTLLFAHLGSIAVAKDDRQGVIDAQTEIGRVGATGLGTDSTADHLHYEQQVGGGPRPIVIESRTWTVGDDPATVDIRDDRGDLASHPGVSHVSENCAELGPGDPADVTTKPDDLPTRLPWAAGTSASITAGYGQEVVPGDWASVRFGLAPGSDVVAAITGDILYAGPATGRFAGLGNIVIERRVVGDRDFELLYTGLATVQPALSFTDSGHVIGTAGDDGVGFAILEGAQLVQGGDTGLAGGTPVYPEPLLGDGWYEHFQWWPGPMTARDLDTAAGDPWARWARGTGRDAGHIPLGDGVDIVTHVTDPADLREVRFAAYYRDWADPRAARRLDGFDPRQAWRILAVCRPRGVSGEPGRTDGCRWDGDLHDATVTFHWDPSTDERKALVPWLPKADAAITDSDTGCVPVTLAVDVNDAAGYRDMTPAGRTAGRCDATADDLGRTVYLDPLAPPAAPTGVKVTPSQDCFSFDGSCEMRVRWTDRSTNESAFLVYISPVAKIRFGPPSAAGPGEILSFTCADSRRQAAESGADETSARIQTRPSDGSGGTAGSFGAGYCFFVASVNAAGERLSEPFLVRLGL